MGIKSKILISFIFAFFGSAQAANTVPDIPDNWDGLTEVKPKQMEAAYLLPGADFRPYTKVMIDPSIVAMQKNWAMKNNTNLPPGDLSGFISKTDVQEIIAAAQKNFDEVFAETLTKKGYQVVTEPGADVLHLAPQVVGLYINAPQVNGPSFTRQYVMEAGLGTLVLEARDSMTNTVLGRVLDSRETRSSGGMQVATRSSNVSDYRALVSTWATICAKGLDGLKAVSPVPMDLKPKQEL